ncbi:MAG TPA: RHS repeat-associated core domain-containing protein [Thermoplasmata archaeon]
MSETESIGYTYDADGNRLTSREVKVGGSLVVTTYTYGKEDQLLKAVITGGATTTYTYDKDGNLKTSVTGSATTTYAYDIENRLTSVTTSSSTTSYAYSADSRRLKRVSGGTTTYFGNDPMTPSRMDDTIEEYTSTGTKTTTYLHGIGVDELLGYKTNVWYSYHGDAIGSVTRLTDSGGGTPSTYRYDAFGAMRSQTGLGNTYGFASRERESAGLYFSRARYYDSGYGRFLTRDPAGMVDGTNLYSYAGNNPVNRIDPSGMAYLRFWVDCWWWFCVAKYRLTLNEPETQSFIGMYWMFSAGLGATALALALLGVTAPAAAIPAFMGFAAAFTAGYIQWVDGLGGLRGVWIETWLIPPNNPHFIWHN